MKISGTGSVFINFKTDKIFLPKGGSRWMIRMLQPLFNIYKGKHLTSNLIESKNSQVKRHGGDSKQQNAVYGHKLFSFCPFVAEYDYLHLIQVEGRPLNNKLMIEQPSREWKYHIYENGTNYNQKVMDTYFQKDKKSHNLKVILLNFFNFCKASRFVSLTSDLCAYVYVLG